jgi:hypothetical protein
VLHRTKWKGSVMRVELAKEHYMQKLQREWAEPTPTGASANEPSRSSDGSTTAKGSGAVSEKRVSTWRRGKSARLLPVLTVRRPNGCVAVPAARFDRCF